MESKQRKHFFKYNGKEHLLSIKAIDTSTLGRNFNQMETLHMAIHVLAVGSADGKFEWYVLPVTEVAKISMKKSPQHGGTKAEDFIAQIEDVDSKFIVKSNEIVRTLENIIDNQSNDPVFKILDARMQIERLRKESDRKNYDLFLTELFK